MFICIINAELIIILIAEAFEESIRQFLLQNELRTCSWSTCRIISEFLKRSLIRWDQRGLECKRCRKAVVFHGEVEVIRHTSVSHVFICSVRIKGIDCWPNKKLQCRRTWKAFSDGTFQTIFTSSGYNLESLTKTPKSFPVLSCFLFRQSV